ncbi:tRNA-binding protein [Shigella flexneri]
MLSLIVRDYIVRSRLLRSLQTSELALPALRGRLQKNVSDAQLCTTLKLSGRKMLLGPSAGRGRAGAVRT